MASRHLLAVAVQIAVALAVVPIDQNCTVDGKYADNAFVCKDNVDQVVCDSLYTPAANAADRPAVGNDKERPGKCFDKVDPGVAIDESMKATAIKLCPKSCGYCCMSPEYSCENSRNLKYFTSCNDIKPTMCKDGNWREYIAEDCPNVCGFCLEGGCVDAAVDCATTPGICNNMYLQDFVKEKCKRTCNFCNKVAAPTTKKPAQPQPPTAAPPANTCFDTHPSCASWKGNGFCTKQFYDGTDDRLKYCKKTCGLC